jgi:hypothetical protein
MASVVDICNRALSILGQESISSLSENTPIALACRTHWPPIRKSVLGSHTWNGVTKRAVLSRLLERPAFGFKYYYQLPSDCLWAARTEDEAFFQVEGRKLLTDSESVKLLYVADTEDSTIFAPKLVDALVYHLASELAYTMTKSTSLAQGLISQAESKTLDAKAADSFEGKKPDLKRNRLIRSKLS